MCRRGGGREGGPTLAVTDPLGGTLLVPAVASPASQAGRIQVKTVFNQERLELIVSILAAAGLKSRQSGQYR